MIFSHQKNLSMSKTRKTYTKEEKLKIVELSYQDGYSVKELADRFEISINSLYNWRSAYKKHSKDAFPGKGNKQLTDIERENETLKKQLKQAEIERDILKKAVSIFSKSDSKFTNL